MAVTTLSEVLEVDWALMSDEQRIVEIQAAVRCFEIFKLANAEKVPIHLPSDEDLAVVAKGDMASSSVRSMQKKYAAFLAWWAPPDKTFVSKARQLFLCKECVFYCRQHPEGAPEASVIQEFQNTNILSAAEMAALKDWATGLSPHYCFPSAKDAVLSPVERVFQRFRSWYCGGDALQDWERQQWEAGPGSMGAALGRDAGAGEGARPGAAGSGIGGLFDEADGSVTTADGPAAEAASAILANRDSVSGELPAPESEVPPFGFEAITDELQTHDQGPLGFVPGMDFGGAAFAAEFQSVFPARRLADRTACLVQRRTHVDQACALCLALVEQYKQAEKKGLGEKDLTLRRAKLLQEDLELIMASIKLLQLLAESKLCKAGMKPDVQKLGVPRSDMSPALICGANIFAIVGPELLTPEPPPALIVATLPGTDRRPMRAWQLCTEEEKMTEITLAVALDCVLCLAVMDGISVPDPEDIDLDKALVPLRAKRLADFIIWYTGDEGKDKVPGRGIPTLARVLFAETLEGAAVTDDPFVVQTMMKEKMPLPEPVLERHKARAELEQMLLDAPSGVLAVPPPPDESDELSTDGNSSSKGDGDDDGTKKKRIERHAPQTPEQTELLKTAFDRDAADTLKVFYENSLTTVAGLSIRLTLIRRYIDAIITCRRHQMMLYMMPPGPARLSHMMMFPPAGPVFPPYELPPFRFRALFPSRNVETAYTHKEMEQWYSAKELDEDDRLMYEAEMDGRKRAVYLEWLAQEKERQKETRIHMLDEDRLGQQRRAYQELLQERLRRIDSLRPIETKSDFVLEAALPGSYEYIKEDTIEYEYGGGLENEDELEDIRLEVERKAEEARGREAERRRLVEEERQRRIAEEEAAQRREEVNQRLIENMERRRLVREHLEHVKNKRRMEASEKLRAIKEAEQEALVAKQHQRTQAQAVGVVQTEARARLREQAEMEVQDFFCHEVYIASAECALMEHEDILASLRATQEARLAAALVAKRLELEEIYAPFVPFAFRKDKLRLPTLHSVLSSYPAEAAEFDGLSRERLGINTASLSESYLGSLGVGASTASGSVVAVPGAQLENRGVGFGGSMSGKNSVVGFPDAGLEASFSFVPALQDTGGQDGPSGEYKEEGSSGVDAEARERDRERRTKRRANRAERAAKINAGLPTSPVTMTAGDFPARQPASVLAPLILQPLIWAEPGTGLDIAAKQSAALAESTARAVQEEYEAERFRGGRKRRCRAASSPSAVFTAEGKDKDYYPAPFAGDPEKAMQESLMHAYRAQDQQQRPHTSGSARQFHLFDTPEMGPHKYTLPSLDPSFTNVFANQWPAAGAGESVRAVSAGFLDGPRRARGDGPDERANRPSIESLGTLGSLINVMTTSIRENSQDTAGGSPPILKDAGALEEAYLLDLLSSARDKRRAASREGARPRARAPDAHVNWSVIEASQSGEPNPAVSTEGSAASAMQLQRILSQSAEVASAIMQRHTLELQLRQERAAAASLAVLDRRGLSSVALKKPTKLPTTGSVAKKTIDAANAITQAYLQNKGGLREYTHSRSVLEDEYFLATAITGIGGELEPASGDDSGAAGAMMGAVPAGGSVNVFANAVKLDSERNMRRRRELLGLVAEELGMVPATTNAMGEKNQGAAAAEQGEIHGGARTKRTASLGVMPVLGYPSAYPARHPLSDHVRKDGERLSRADRRGLRYTRTPDVLPTAENPRQRPFGVKGGHYTIREYHPKYGLQPLILETSLEGSQTLLTLSSTSEAGVDVSDGALQIGENSMNLEDGEEKTEGATSSQRGKKGTSRGATRNRSPGRGVIAISSLEEDDVCVSGVSVASGNSSLEGVSLMSIMSGVESAGLTEAQTLQRGRLTPGPVEGLDGVRIHVDKKRTGHRKTPKVTEATDDGMTVPAGIESEGPRSSTNTPARGPGIFPDGLMLGADMDDADDPNGDEQDDLGSISFSPEKSAVSSVRVMPKV